MSSESQISSQPLGVSLYCSLAHATFGMYQKKPEHVLTMYGSIFAALQLSAPFCYTNSVQYYEL